MTGRDPVSNETAIRVFTRDGECLGAKFHDPSPCRGRIQLDHVPSRPHVGDPIQKRGPKRRHRYRAPSLESSLISVCAHHHLDGFATSHRAELREYLASFQREDQAA